MSTAGVTAALAKCSLFKDFSETGLAIMASIAVVRSLPAKAPLFVEGMSADAFFVVKAGTIRIALRGEGDEDQLLGYLGEGEALGQLALLAAEGARVSSAVAHGPVEVVEIRQTDFVRLQSQKPQACLKLMMAVAAQLGRDIRQNQDLLRAVALAPV